MSESLAKYDTDYQTDTDLLAQNEKDNKLSDNVRNCLLYRHGEKKILQFLLETANRILTLIPLSYKDAKREVNNYKNSEGIQDYIRT